MLRGKEDWKGFKKLIFVGKIDKTEKLDSRGEFFIFTLDKIKAKNQINQLKLINTNLIKWIIILLNNLNLLFQLI